MTSGAAYPINPNAKYQPLELGDKPKASTAEK
jgi:hypothetical protein